MALRLLRFLLPLLLPTIRQRHLMGRHKVPKQIPFFRVFVTREFLAAHGLAQTYKARIAMAGDGMFRVVALRRGRRAVSHRFVVL